MPVRWVAGFESPFGFVPTTEEFVHDRQRNSATERVESPGAEVDDAGRCQPLLPRELGRRGDPDLSGQALFRTLNEEIRRLADTFGVDEDLELVCECGDSGCFARLSIPRAEFEAARSVPVRFLVAADHVGPADTVVRRDGRYAVVEDRRRERARS